MQCTGALAHLNSSTARRGQNTCTGGHTFGQHFRHSLSLSLYISVEDCTGHCQNGGRCYLTPGNYVACDCPAGYYGNRCESKSCCFHTTSVDLKVIQGTYRSFVVTKECLVELNEALNTKTVAMGVTRKFSREWHDFQPKKFLCFFCAPKVKHTLLLQIFRF